MSPSDNEGNGALVDRNPGEIEPGILVDETKCGEDGAVALLKDTSAHSTAGAARGFKARRTHSHLLLSCNGAVALPDFKI